MSLNSLGTLARERRMPTAPQPSGGIDGLANSLEAAIPTEVVALYTAIIAGCQSVLNQDGHSAYLAFRLVIYVVALVATISIAFRSVRPAIGGDAAYRSMQTLQSPELLTATLSFAAWGVSLPGSFLYVWLSVPTLSIVVITVTAVTGFVLAAFFAPKLRSRERGAHPASKGPSMTPVRPANTP
jgi:hypothetical protein